MISLLLALALSPISQSAYANACPNLTGIYTHVDPETSELTTTGIQQESCAVVQVTEDDETTILSVDNQIHIVYSQGADKLTYQAKWANQMLDVQFVATTEGQNNRFKMTMELMSNSNLKQTVIIPIQGTDQVFRQETIFNRIQ